MKCVMSCLSMLQEAVIKVFTDKVPKVVVAAVDVVTSALRWVVIQTTLLS